MRRRRTSSPSPEPVEAMAIFRARIRIDRFASSLSTIMIVAFVFYSLSMAIAILDILVNVTPAKIAHAFVEFLPIFLPWHDLTQSPTIPLRDLTIVLAMGFYAEGGAFIAWVLGTYVHGALEMRAYRRSPSPDRIRWDRWFKPRLPLWVTAQRPVVNPSPTTILDVTQAYEQGKRPLSQDVYEVIASNLESSDVPPIRYHIVLREYLTVTILGPDGKQETLVFEHHHWTALIAYLALQPPGTWVHRDRLLHKIYASPDRSTFTSHVHRINEHLTKQAAKVGILSEDADRKPIGKLALFELDEKTHEWRLNRACDVEVFPELNALASQVEMVREHPEDLSLEHVHTLFQACEHVATGYGEGLLAAHQEYESLWSWARDPHLAYRDRWLETLTNLATFLVHLLDEQPLRAEEREHLLREAMAVSRWKALAALGRLPKIAAGEPALQQCLALCYQLRDVAMGVDVFQAFSRRMQYLDYRWHPTSETVHLWPEVTSRPKSRRTRVKNLPWLA